MKRAGLLSGGIKRGPMGSRYLDLLEALNRVRSQSGRNDFREIDELAYQAARTRSAGNSSTIASGEIDP